MDDVHPKMRYSLSPPASKAIFSSTISFGSKWNKESVVAKSAYQNDQNGHNNNNNDNIVCNVNCDKNAMQREEDRNNSNKPTSKPATDAETTSDYKQWLHAMKLVARLPGGIPPEFRRKLWLSLADKYLKSKNVDWPKEEEKCFCEKWREDDSELGIQIVKDLHRTGSTLCTGPAGDINQAKLKRILLGYARYNPEVGYCQGFNMLGALILQVMDKEETESMKVMIYLVEGILPPGYFCGSMGGLQADMAVFRELMQIKLPRLARHLQKLQGPIENAYEPPLTNVFTMQWFLTMFCTCLPMSCVLRVWDLVLIEGSDVLLRTALALWSLLEDRVLSTRSADDFYGKMGSFSSELLNGHLIDSNGLIEKVVQLGPIQDIQKLRDKHLNSMTPLKHKQGLNLYYDEDEADIDEDSRIAVATVWGLSWGRRGSQGQTANALAKQAVESKDRIALDISLLKKQYDRLRERQKQAHIILTTACSSARQSTGSTTNSSPLPVNQLLSGRPAIVTNRGRRSGPPSGAIPPARKPSLPAVLQDKPLEKKLRRGETLQWRDTSDNKRRRDSLTWKEIRAERASLSASGSIEGIKSQKIRTKRLGKSDSSSYSEESEDEPNDKAGSSSDTSLCDDDNQVQGSGRNYPTSAKTKKLLGEQKSLASSTNDHAERQRPKSWAPSNSDIPFVLMTTDSPNNSADECAGRNGELQPTNAYMQLTKEEDEDEDVEEDENSATESDQNQFAKDSNAPWNSSHYTPLKENMIAPSLKPLFDHSEGGSPQILTLNAKEIETTPLEASAPAEKARIIDTTNSLGSEDSEECDETKEFGVSDEGVTNQYFERVNSTERPTKLDLLYSLNEETCIRDAYKDPEGDENLMKNNKNRCMDILVDYSEKSSAACIAEAKTEISTSLQKSEYYKSPEVNHTSTAASKRRNPRRLTLTRSSTMEIEKRYQALEKRLSMEVSSKYRMPSLDKNNHSESTLDEKDYTKACDEDVSEFDLHRSYQRNDRNKSECHELPDKDKETANRVVSLLQRKSKIPTTADLELRFASIVLDKVSKVSDSESSETSRKAPTSPKEAPKRASANGGNTKDADRGNNAPKDNNVKDETKSNTERLHSPSDAHSEDADKGGISKTAKTSNVEPHDSKAAAEQRSTQRKKEPPDTGSPKDPDKSREKEVSDSSKDDSERNKKNTVTESQQSSEHSHEHDENSPTADTNKNQSKSKKDLKSNSPTHSETKGDHQKRKGENKQTDDRASDAKNQTKDATKTSPQKSVQKKSPPSTEELEKRFNALEKQMSTSKTEDEEIIDDPSTPTVRDKEATSTEHQKEGRQNKSQIEREEHDAKKFASSRRASEPPSTEDLEKRYEIFKRRMSSKAFEMNRNKRLASETSDYAEDDFAESMDSDGENKKHPTVKESPPSTDSLEKRFHKLQSENIQSPQSKDSLSDIMHMAVKAHKAMESPTKNKDSLSGIVQMAVDASKAADSPTKERNRAGDKLGNIAQMAMTANETAQTPATHKENFSDIMQKAVKTQSASETPNSGKESFSDVMHKAVIAQRAEESPTAGKESFSDIMHKAVKAQRAEESPTATKDSFSDVMHKAVKAQRAEESPTGSKESFSDIMHKAVKAQRAEESPTAGKESFSDIMHKAVKAQRAEESPTASKESFSDVMHKAVKAQRAEESPTASKESFSDIMHKAVKAQRAEESPIASKESFSDIMHKAVQAQRADESPTAGKDSFSDIMQKAVKAQRANESPTTSKDGLSGIVQMAVDSRKTNEAPVKSEDKFSDVAQKALKANKLADSPTTSKNSLSGIVQMAVESRQTVSSPTKGESNVSSAESKKALESPAKNKETFSDIMHMAVKAQRQLETPTKSGNALSDTVQMAIEAKRANERGSAEAIPDAPEQRVDEVSGPRDHLKDKNKQGSRSALIEELQSKLGADGEFIKPSSINPNRKTPQTSHILRKSNTDETSETHATTAYSKSEKYEHIHSHNRKMVRRFSDLPSRADLENRLLFLEEQLSKTLLQQRRASDSEVASHSRDFARPPGTLRYAGKLEARVRDLEKQLSGTGKAPKKLDNLHIDTSRIPLEITTDSIDTTGKELVRYTHYGEIDEPDTHNPINISINIHMTLNKDDLERSSSKSLSKAEEINKRLLILEQQLKTSHINIASSSSIPRDLCEASKDTSTDPSASGVLQKQTTLNEAPRAKADAINVDEVAKDDSESTSKAEVQTEITHEEVLAKADVVTLSNEHATTKQSDSNKPETTGESDKVTRKPQAETVQEKPEASEDPSTEKVSASETVSTRVEESLKETSASVKEKAVPTPKTPSDVKPPTKESDVSKDEETRAKDAKRDSIAKTNDLDRRLQILEDHIRKSHPTTLEQQTERTSTSRACHEDNKKTLESATSAAACEPEATKLPENTQEEHVTKSTAIDDASTKQKDDSTTEEAVPKEDDTMDHQAQDTSGSKTLEAALVETAGGTQMVPVEVNKKTLVLVLDNEPKAVKVRRLTRANTEELEGLFQALEKQLIERSQIKHQDIAGKSTEHTDAKNNKEVESKSSHEFSDLTKEIEAFSKSSRTQKTPTPQKPGDSDDIGSSRTEKTPNSQKPRESEDFDWGRDPMKHHLKKKTVYLPSTKELESRFRSLERQIKILEDVEKIDVEQRLMEIDRKLKLQYSLSHEKDLVRFLELCEGKGLDEITPPVEQYSAERNECHEHCCEHNRPNIAKRAQSPGRVVESDILPQSSILSAADLRKSRQKSAEKKREPIHPLEMLLDPSPDERDIPTTGELEHRMRVMEENRGSPSPASKKSHSKSPIRAQTSTNIQIPESPSPSGLPTAEQLEARLAALEKEQRFDFKMQKNYKQFNQKLKDIISPSLSFEEFKAARSSSSESASRNVHRSPSPRATGCDASCPKVIRFYEDEHQRLKSRNDCETMVSMSNDVVQILEENSKMIQRLLKKPIADSHNSAPAPAPAHSSIHEGLGVMGIRLMRETSPLRRKGTHTGVPLRTGENINDQLTSIKNTIKSIDTLCEEKPYRKERCQQYIDSLFTESTYFASKKSSLDDLTSRHLSRSTSREYGPSIRISELSPAFTRSIGSAESIRSSSPLRPTTPQQYHSNRDLRREVSPRRRRDEEREENESRVRRDNLLPNIHTLNHSSLSHSLTKFHKVDSQLISNDIDDIDAELLETYRQPATFSSNETSSIRDSNTNTSNIANTTMTPHTNAIPTNDTTYKASIIDRPISPYRQLGLGRSNTPVYSPAKLEIRHTTVTSTFYDRVLAEKQLEKKHSTTSASRSPLLDLPIRPSFQTDISPTTVPLPESNAIPLAGPGSDAGNYRSYHSAILAQTPSPAIAKDTLSNSPIHSIPPKT